MLTLNFTFSLTSLKRAEALSRILYNTRDIFSPCHSFTVAFLTSATTAFDKASKPGATIVTPGFYMQFFTLIF